MNYSLLVMSSPASGHCNLTAARFAGALLARGHRIQRVFFLDDGTFTGAANAVAPQDETDPLTLWQQLGAEHGVDLVLCISSALRRGMLDGTEADRHDKPAASVHEAFSLSGLGQLVDACAGSDRVVTFGG